MECKDFFFEETNLVPYVSFVINRPYFTRWQVRERTIEDHELVLITRGEGDLRIGEEVHPCSRGTLLYLHYDEWHSLEAYPQSPINFFSVHFAYSLAAHTHESWSYHKDINYYLKNEKQTGQNWSFSTDPGLLPFPDTMSVSNYEKVKELFVQLNSTYHEKQVGYNLKLSILCLELLFAVSKECFFSTDRSENVKRLDSALHYIENHYTERIRLSDLCACVNLSESNLIMMFKKQLGRTPVEYINQTRVNKAKELLLRTSNSIKEIAFSTGFNDEFYFSRVFKKLEGKSPRTFRHQMLS